MHRGLSRGFARALASVCARAIPGLPVPDPTEDFDAWHREMLEDASLDGVRSEGYAFEIEMHYRAAQAGFAPHESPLVLTDWRVGQSKMSWRVTFEAVIRVWTMHFGRGS